MPRFRLHLEADWSIQPVLTGFMELPLSPQGYPGAVGRTGLPGDPGPMGIPGVPTIVLWRNSREDWQTFTVSHSHARGELRVQIPTSACSAGMRAGRKGSRGLRFLICWDRGDVPRIQVELTGNGSVGR